MRRRPIELDVDCAARNYAAICNDSVRFLPEHFAAAIQSGNPQRLRSLLELAEISVTDSVGVMFKAHGGRAYFDPCVTEKPKAAVLKFVPVA